MASRGAVGGPRVKRVMTQAVNLIFEFLKKVTTHIFIPKYCAYSLLNFNWKKQKDRVQLWLYENTALKIEGVIIVSY